MAKDTISGPSKSSDRMMKSIASARDDKNLHQIEKVGPRNTNYNETVRANNKRYDRGAPGKTLPRGKVADQTWRGKKRSSSR